MSPDILADIDTAIADHQATVVVAECEVVFDALDGSDNEVWDADVSPDAMRWVPPHARASHRSSHHHPLEDWTRFISWRPRRTQVPTPTYVWIMGGQVDSVSHTFTSQAETCPRTGEVRYYLQDQHEPPERETPWAACRYCAAPWCRGCGR